MCFWKKRKPKYDMKWLKEKTAEGEYNHKWWSDHPELCEENITIVGSVEHNIEWVQYYQAIGEILRGGLYEYTG